MAQDAREVFYWVISAIYLCHKFFVIWVAAHIYAPTIWRSYIYTSQSIEADLRSWCQQRIKAWHRIGAALDVAPSRFFTEVFADDRSSIDPQALDEIRQKMARYDMALEELETQGLIASTWRDA